MSNGYHARRIMGPIILITVGLLFLLDELFPYRGWGIGHTWPVILVVIGAVKILERFFAPAVPTFVPPPASPGSSPGNPTWQAPAQTPGSATSQDRTQNPSAGTPETPKS
jgi:cell wall-active antibiotic response 4TMS protein YvqF